MNQKTFLNKLKRELRHIPGEDREDAVSYYKEYFQEMGIEEDGEVPQELGLPEEIARQIIGDCTKKHVERQEAEGGVKNSATAVWMMVLAIFAAPIGLPFAFATVMVLFAIALVFAAVLFSIFCAAAASVVGGIFLFPAVLAAGSLAQSLVCGGISLLFAGLGILLFYGMTGLSKELMRSLTRLFQRIFAGKNV